VQGVTTFPKSEATVLNSHTVTVTANQTADDVTVNSGGTLSVNNGVTLDISSGEALIVNGTLKMPGTSAITGAGNFTLVSGATIEIGSANGITASGTSGNIQNTGTTRSFSTGANYIYNSTASQATGDGLNQNTPANITISNPGNTVTLSASTDMSGTLTVNAGSTLALSSNTLGATTAPTGVTLYCGATAGSSISGTGTLTLGGNVTVTNSGTGSDDATISCPIALGTSNRTFTVNDGSGSVDLTLGGAVSNGTGGLVKSGAGTMEITASIGVLTNGLTVSAGKFQLTSTGGLNNSLAVILNGGTFSTGATTGYGETAGTLQVTETSWISFGSGSHTLAFDNSDAVGWTSGKTLYIMNWVGGYDGTSGVSGKLSVGTTGTGLTTGQLGQIQFHDGFANYSAKFLSGTYGEVVPYSRGITTGTVSGSPFCAGESGITVPFTYNAPASFPSGTTTFTAELSDDLGSFSSPTSIGTVASNASGSQSISATIPADAASGSGYLIRVVSNNPLVTGTDNGTGLTVNLRPTSDISGGTDICAGSSTQLSVALTGTQPWNLTWTDGTTPTNVTNITSSPYTFNVNPGSTKTYTVTALSDAQCTALAGDMTGSALRQQRQHHHHGERRHAAVPVPDEERCRLLRQLDDLHR